jgi:hypothetical protein
MSVMPMIRSFPRRHCQGAPPRTSPTVYCWGSLQLADLAYHLDAVAGGLVIGFLIGLRDRRARDLDPSASLGRCQLWNSVRLMP